MRHVCTRSLLPVLVLATGGAALAEALVVDGSNSPYLVQAPATYDSVTVQDGGVLVVNAKLTALGDMRVRSTGRVTMDAGVYVLELAVGGAFEVELGGSVDVAGLGLPANVSIEPVTGAPRPYVPTVSGGPHLALGGSDGSPPGYDEPSDPRWPGAGGGASSLVPVGMMGGGALLVTARTARVDGVLRADGVRNSMVNDSGGGGGGGTINLTVEALSGGGVLSAVGGASCGWCSSSQWGSGAGGLLRVAAASWSFSGTVAVSPGAGQHRGGLGTAVHVESAPGRLRVLAGAYPLRAGERWSAFDVDPGASVTVKGAATVATPVTVAEGATLVLATPSALDGLALNPTISGTLQLDTDLVLPAALVLTETAELVVNGRVTVPRLETRPGAVVSHAPGVTAMHLVVPGTLSLVAGARIDAVGRGFAAQRSADPVTGQETAGSDSMNGGSHAGLGGQQYSQAARAPAFDDPTAPRLPGGGGGGGSGGAVGGAGGGLVRVTAGFFQLDGALTVDGACPVLGEAGCGAGGSIVVRAGTLAGAGSLLARGCQVLPGAVGGGGGGLVHVTTAVSSFTGELSAAGGVGRTPGGPGVVTQKTEPMAPSIVSTPPTAAALGELLAYAPVATGTGPFTWSLVEAPEDVALEVANGALAWRPTSVGRFDFTLAVEAPLGRAEQRFTVSVDVAQDEPLDVGPPRIRSSPSTAATCRVAYRYSGAGTPTVDGARPLRFGVERSLDVPLPSDLAVDPVTGAFDWTPGDDDVGVHPLELVVTNGQGRARQSWAIVVTCPSRGPLSVGCGCGLASGPSALACASAALALALARRRRRRRT